MSINKLKNIWVSNDTGLTGAYGNNVSMLNYGKTELQGNTLINSKLAINKNIDTVNDYKLDVSGNINFSGNLYKNNTLFSSGISLADVQGNANTFTNSNTFSGDLVQTNKNILQKADVSNATTYNWTFGSSQIIILTASINPPTVTTLPTINFNLPTVSTANLGTLIYIQLVGLSYIVINAPSGYNFSDESNLGVSSKTYLSSSNSYFCLIAKATPSSSSVLWAIINSAGASKQLIPTLTDTQTFITGTKTFNCPVEFSQLPTTSLTTFGSTNFITKAYGDLIYKTIDSTVTYDTFITKYNTYISFVSILNGDIMNFINCNPTLSANYYLNITGASIKANNILISDVKLSFLNLVSNNKIPSSAISDWTLTNNFSIDNRTVSGSNVIMKSNYISLFTPDTNVPDRSVYGVIMSDDSGRIYFSTYPNHLNEAYINPNSVTGFTYFNQVCVFQKGITLQTNGGVGGSLQVGTGYGGGSIYVYNGSIQIDTNLTSNSFKSNTIEPYTVSSVSKMYSTITNTLNIGNPVNTYNVNMYGNFAINGLNKFSGMYSSTGGSLQLNFGDSQYLILENYPIVTNITLPNPTTSANIGAVFTLVNRAGNQANRVVIAPSGQVIRDFNANADYSSFSMNDIGVAQFLCVGLSSTSTTTWVVISRGDTVLKSNSVSQSITGIKTFISPPVMSGASITDGSIPLSALVGQSSVMAYPVGTSFSQQPNTTVTTGVIWDFINSAGTRRGLINGTSASAVAYTTTSDKRLKKDIENLPSQIDNIKKLNVRKYKWIESNEDDIGFIYQEVKDVFPLFDDKQDDNNFHGIDYGRFTPYLFSGVKELINRVEIIENNVNVETNPNVYLLKDVIQQQKDFKVQLNLQEERLNNNVGQLIINEQQEKINHLENIVLSLQKQLNQINNILISKNIL